MSEMKFKYVRIHGKELAKNTMFNKGVFSMCWHLIQQDIMVGEDADLFREIDGWFAENLPWPPQCMNQEPVVCWFKTENSDEMIKMIRPALWLLERYEHPYYLVYTNFLLCQKQFYNYYFLNYHIFYLHFLLLIEN